MKMKTQIYYDNLYKQINEILDSTTPLRKDCGLVCDKSCCKGDEGTGMLLFPFEKTSLTVKEKDGVRLCVCSGSCNRDERPLSCRIFPLFPYLSKEGELSIIPDVRGINVCPLVENYKSVRWSRAFNYKMKKIARLLIKDEETRAFIYNQSREIDSILSFLG